MDLAQTIWTAKIPITNLFRSAQSPCIQLAIFVTPQLCQYMELEGHFWTGDSVLPRVDKSTENIGKIVNLHLTTLGDFKLTKPLDRT